MIYQIEFIRYLDGRAEPDVIFMSNGDYPNIEEAKDHGQTLFATLEAAKNAQGFRVRENGGPVVAHWFPGAR